MSKIQIDEFVMRNYLMKELPSILEEEPEIQKIIVKISQKKFSDRDKTDERFERFFEELRKDREESNKKWEENNKKWEEISKRLEEQGNRLDEHGRRLDEQGVRLDALIRQSDERFAAMMAELKDIRRRQDSSIGALGARWGISAESSFRNALKGILEDRFDVKVLNITEYDNEGTVFGHPDQVELDIIIRNGEIIACEIKSSMSRSDMYTFFRKVQFYEKNHECKVITQMVISPMVDKYAQIVAERLGIIVYSYAENAQL